MPKSRVYVLLGTIGSGKTVQADRLRDQLDGNSLSVGSLIRHHLQNDPRVANGELLPDDEVCEIVKEAIATTPPERTLILDGFPRSIIQKQWLDQHLTSINRQLKAVFYLMIDEAEVDRRLKLRGRADDTPEAIKRRKLVFNDKVLPVIEAYIQDGVVREIDGSAAMDEVTKQLLTEIEIINS